VHEVCGVCSRVTIDLPLFTYKSGDVYFFSKTSWRTSPEISRWRSLTIRQKKNEIDRVKSSVRVKENFVCRKHVMASFYYFSATIFLTRSVANSSTVSSNDTWSRILPVRLRRFHEILCQHWQFVFNFFLFFVLLNCLTVTAILYTRDLDAEPCGNQTPDGITRKLLDTVVRLLRSPSVDGNAKGCLFLNRFQRLFLFSSSGVHTITYTLSLRS
jgi:hypothetical protein